MPFVRLEQTNGILGAADAAMVLPSVPISEALAQLPRLGGSPLTRHGRDPEINAICSRQVDADRVDLAPARFPLPLGAGGTRFVAR